MTVYRIRGVFCGQHEYWPVGLFHDFDQQFFADTEADAIRQANAIGLKLRIYSVELAKVTP